MTKIMILLQGITDFAKRHLAVQDVEELESFIGSEIEYYEEDDDMMVMPDGQLFHIDFLMFNS